MPLCSKSLFRADVEDHLRRIFKNQELVAAIGALEAEKRFEDLLLHLSRPPAFTTVRVNTLLASIEHVKQLLKNEIAKQFPGFVIPVLQHPRILDVLLVPVIGPRKTLEEHPLQVIVRAQCGNAVLRGAHVFVPGIMSASKWMKAGNVVSVYSDIEGKCRRGAIEFSGNKMFIGNGISEISRKDIFNSNAPLKGVGVRMTDPVYLSPSFDNMLPSYLFLQNLPSVVVSHVLDPQSGERILDMCAAPGGKTTHIAALMGDQGEVIAMDKIANKVEKIKHNAKILKLNCIKAFCYDGTKALAFENVNENQGPPFLPEYFDRILLDAPCSGLGQRPNMACDWTLNEVTSYPPLQRKLFSVAVKLLKPGGILVYSTCTITLAENEELVDWALTAFPCLELQEQEPHIGGEGMKGAGIPDDQLKLLQRFHPSSTTLEDSESNSVDFSSIDDMVCLANRDSIGFFIAKFIKRDQL